MLNSECKIINRTCKWILLAIPNSRPFAAPTARTVFSKNTCSVPLYSPWRYNMNLSFLVIPSGSNTSPQDEPRTAQTTRSPPTATTPIATRSNTKNLPRPESITRYPTRPTIPIRTQPTTKTTTTAVPKVTTKERLLSTRTIMTRKIVIEKNTFINGKSMPAVIVRGPTNDGMWSNT